MKSNCQGTLFVGKTSFLRRYFTGKFEYGNRKSTLGADFYSKIVTNPLYIENNPHNDDIDDSASSLKSSIKTDEKKRHKKISKKKKKKKDKKQSSNDSITSATTATSDTKSTIINHLNDTITHGLDHDPYITTPPHIALQIWDTAGKERLLTSSSTTTTTTTTSLTSRLGDSFFNHADAAILIYDATSSASFLQLIQWYSELLERVDTMNQVGSNSSSGSIYYHCDDPYSDKEEQVQKNCKSSTKRVEKRTTFPVLVVATKLDRLRAEQSRQARKKNVPQRNVLGLKQFNGQEYHYEYATEYNTKHNNNNNNNNNNNITQNLNIKNSDGNVPLSYGLECGAWTTDKEYQDYLKVAEDECFPDRYMVRLWCKRNGLEHVDVSALDGIGVDNAIDTMIDLALKSISVKMAASHGTNKEARRDTKDMNGGHKVPVDFHQRYKASDKDNCNFCRCLIRR
jgi:GTPase SAR1 family protein